MNKPRIYFTGPSSLLKEVPFLLHEGGFRVRFERISYSPSEGVTSFYKIIITRRLNDVFIFAGFEFGKPVFVIVPAPFILMAGCAALHADIVSCLAGHGLTDLLPIKKPDFPGC